MISLDVQFRKINELIETRINGNQIKGNKTYENMLKSITSKDFMQYDNFCFPGKNPTMFIYKKIDKIEKYVDLLKTRRDK